MASNPPILPVTVDQTAAAAAAAPPVGSPAFRLFLSRLSDSLRRSLSRRRPWSELLDRSALSRPASLSDAASRLRRNLPYFRVNYLILLAFALAVSLLSHPFSLLVLLALAAAWSLLYLFRPADSPLVILGRTFSERETLTGLSLLTILIVFLTSVGSLLISAVLVGGGIVCVHGAFRMPEDLFLDDQEAAGAGSGLLSFLGGAAAAGAPGIAVRG